MDKRISIAITVLSLIGLVILQYWFAQWSRPSFEVENLNTITERIEDLETQYELASGESDNAKKSTTSNLVASAQKDIASKSDIEKLKMSLEKSEMKLRSQFDLLLKFGIPLTIIAFIMFFLSLYKFVYDTAKEKATAEISRYFKPEVEKLKEQSRILLLTKAGHNDKEVEKYLQSAGFISVTNKKLTEFSLDAFEKNELRAQDLIIFNNEKDNSLLSFTESEAEIVMKENPNAMIFWLRGPNLNKIMKSPNVSSARFLAQLYGNVLSLLAYQNSSQRNGSYLKITNNETTKVEAPLEKGNPQGA